jgi:hypothetical protein
MNPTSLSRRGFLGSLVVNLTACLCLCPRPSQASVVPGSTVALPPGVDACWLNYTYDSMGQRCTTYEYDGMDRLVRVTDHPSGPSFTHASGHAHNSES